MIAFDYSSTRKVAASPLNAPIADLRPGDIDLSDPKTFVAGVPHEYFRVLREQEPVHWQDECELPVFLPGPGYWALTRYEDVTFEEFLRRFPDVRRAGPPERLHSNFINGIKRMPVRLN